MRASPSHWQACGKLLLSGQHLAGMWISLPPYPTTLSALAKLNAQSVFSRVPLSIGAAARKQVQSVVDFLAHKGQPWPTYPDSKWKTSCITWCYLAQFKPPQISQMTCHNRKSILPSRFSWANSTAPGWALQVHRPPCFKVQMLFPPKVTAKSCKRWSTCKLEGRY